jgi:preprotein translocase YajC subunit
MGILLLAAGSAPAKKGGSPVFFIVLLVAFGLIYFLVLRPRRARMMAAQQQRGGSDLIPGQRVRTSAGIYGTVTLVDGTDVEVEIAPGVEVRMLRQAIVAVIPDEEPEDQFDPDTSVQDGEHDAETEDVPDAEPEAGTGDDAGDEPVDDKDPQDHTP